MRDMSTTPRPGSMEDPRKPRPAFKLWLETDDGYVYGPGVNALLQKVEETGTLKEAAAALDMSYRYAWGLIKKAEEKLGESLILAHKGGRSGGGGAELTELGRQYIEEFVNIERTITRASATRPYLGSTRNQVEGTVRGVSADGDYTEIEVEIEGPTILVLRIPSNESPEGISISDKVSLTLDTVVMSVKRA